MGEPTSDTARTNSSLIRHELPIIVGAGLKRGRHAPIRLVACTQLQAYAAPLRLRRDALRERSSQVAASWVTVQTPWEMRVTCREREEALTSSPVRRGKIEMGVPPTLSSYLAGARLDGLLRGGPGRAVAAGLRWRFGQSESLAYRAPDAFAGPGPVVVVSDLPGRQV